MRLVAKRHDNRADSYGVGVGHGGGSHARSRHADQRKIHARIGGDDVGVELPLVGEPEAHAGGAKHMGVRDDDAGRPQDPGAAAGRAPDLDRDLPQPVGDLGKVRRQCLRRGEDARQR